MSARKRTLPPLAMCVLTAILCSCAATSVKKTWKSPALQQPVAKMAVVAIDERSLLRQGFENRFVAQLAKAGAQGAVTFDQLSLAEIKQDKQAAAARFRASGADAVLILRLVSAGSSYRETQPGGEGYAATITGFEYTGWYNYYSMGFMSMSPTYGSQKMNVILETVLFDLQTEKQLWSGLTQTVLKDSTDRVAEMDPLVEKVFAAMRKDGAIRP